MPHRDSGVTELLHRASDDLVPDVDRLVSGGIARGRTRQRRARIGTTIASLAVIGVVGGLVVVVPRLDDTRSAPERTIATQPTPTTPVPTEPAAAAPTSLSRPAADVPATVERILALQGRVSEPDIHLDAPREKFVQFLVDGMVTEVGMHADPDGSRERCEDDAERLDGTCREVEGGGLLLTWGPTLADGVTCTGVDLQRYGFDIWATSCNAAAGKDSAVLAPVPPLDAEQLRVLVSTHAWFD
jgi:hypothetical protein